MKKLLLASATALSMAAFPAAAQIAAGPDATTDSIADKRSGLTTEQQAMYDAMPSDQRADFDTWDAGRQIMYFGWTDALRGYYWDLQPEQQEAWWYLDEEQRISLFQLSAEQREIAWNSVLDQVAEYEADNPASTSPAYTANAPASAQLRDTASASVADINFISNPVVQDVPPPHEGEYPVCQSDADNNCINPWAAGQRGPGVERPLDYWPGESRSGG